jgi:hypothetical protein
MQIIKITANESGSRPPMQDWRRAEPPEGYAEVACDAAAFYEYNGFVTLTVEDDRVTDMQPNIEAWEAWKATLPEPEHQAPTAEERLAALEAAMLDIILGGAV